MKNIVLAIIKTIGQMSVVDMIILIALITFIILILSIVYLYRLYTYDMEVEEEEETGDKNMNDMLDLKAITEKIEQAPKEVNIELTAYEQEQEQKAIISYDELIKSVNSMKINYQDEENKSGVHVRQVDLKNIAVPDKNGHDSEVKLFNYEKEEAFLEALKNLKNMLS